MVALAKQAVATLGAGDGSADRDPGNKDGDFGVPRAPEFRSVLAPRDGSKPLPGLVLVHTEKLQGAAHGGAAGPVVVLSAMPAADPVQGVTSARTAGAVVECAVGGDVQVTPCSQILGPLFSRG